MSNAITSKRQKPNLDASFSCPLYDLHARSTVNAEDLAVDPLAVLRGKEADNTGNINGETNTVERRPGSSEL
jgi:hypothetical protein